jgi:hypothetical protein
LKVVSDDLQDPLEVFLDELEACTGCAGTYFDVVKALPDEAHDYLTLSGKERSMALRKAVNNSFTECTGHEQRPILRVIRCHNALNLRVSPYLRGCDLCLDVQNPAAVSKLPATLLYRMSYHSSSDMNGKMQLLTRVLGS